MTDTGTPFIWRDNADGTHDNSFATNGNLILSDPASDLAIQPDGKIVVVYLTSRLEVARFNPDGSPDPSFGQNGVATLITNANLSPTALAFASKNRIVIASNTDSNTGLLYRLKSNGALDSKFGKRGVVTLKTARLGPVNLRDVAVRKDGRIVAVGNNQMNGVNHRWDVFVFSPKGKLESTLGQPTRKKVTDSEALTISIDRDNSMIVGGEVHYANASSPNDFHGIIAHYPAHGRKIRWHDLGLNKIPSALALAPDSKIIVAYFNGIRRFNANLKPDSTFVYTQQINLDFQGASIAVQDDGNFIIDGGENFNPQNSLATFSSIRIEGGN